jgi:hypothetical protein
MRFVIPAVLLPGHGMSYDLTPPKDQHGVAVANRTANISHGGNRHDDAP